MKILSMVLVALVVVSLSTPVSAFLPNILWDLLKMQICHQNADAYARNICDVDYPNGGGAWAGCFHGNYAAYYDMCMNQVAINTCGDDDY